jgi:hypothetical protein
MGILAPGDHENRRLIFLADAAKQLEPVEAWKPEIHHDQIRSVDLPPSERLRAVTRLGHDKSFTSENVGGQVEDVGIVFHQQDLDHVLPPPIRIRRNESAKSHGMSVKRWEQCHYSGPMHGTIALQRRGVTGSS